LDFPIDPELKRSYVKLLIKLSKDSVLYPQCLVLKEVVKKTGFPVARGGFGEVYRGQFRGQEVAIKVLKIQTKNMDTLLKVIQF
jgi:hypothetical protein